MSMPGFTADGSLAYNGNSRFALRLTFNNNRSRISPQLPEGGRGGPGTRDCVGEYQDCYIDCSVTYPEGNNRDICFSTCDNRYNRCKTPVFGFGGFGGFIA
jgi:hypothetical protein